MSKKVTNILKILIYLLKISPKLNDMIKSWKELSNLLWFFYRVIKPE